jgi:hypothetical protein
MLIGNSKSENLLLLVTLVLKWKLIRAFYVLSQASALFVPSPGFSWVENTLSFVRDCTAHCRGYEPGSLCPLMDFR